jgi:hypothetical protein
MTSIMAACPEDATIRVAESCWSRLEAYIPLFDQCIPRRPGTIGECMVLEKQGERIGDDDHHHDDDSGARDDSCSYVSHNEQVILIHNQRP